MKREEMQTWVDDMVQITLNAKEVEQSNRFWKEDMVWHGPAGLGVLTGIEEFKHKLLYPFFKAFPDYEAINEIWVADEERDMLVAWGYFTGTHQDLWAGVPATGLPVKVGFMDIWQFGDGKLAENWVLVDVADFLRQVGAVDIPETLADAI